MLASLLPGIRHLRAPLAGGYLWLVVGWLVAYSRWPQEADAEGLPKTLYQLADATSVVGKAVAASFVAYLLGSVSEAIFYRLLLTSGRAVGYGLTLPENQALDGFLQSKLRSELGAIRRRLEALRRTVGDSAIAWDLRPFDSFDGLLLSPREVQRAIRERRLPRSLREAVNYASWVLSVVLLGTYQSEWRYYRAYRDLVYFDERPQPNEIGSVFAPGIFYERLEDRIVAELDDLTIQLVSNNPNLYNEVDRFRAEAEFRLAITPPLLALSILGCLTTSWLFVFSLPVVGLLYRQGIARQQQANSIMSRLLRSNIVESPTLREEIARLRTASRSGQAGNSLASDDESLARQYLGGRAEAETDN